MVDVEGCIPLAAKLHGAHGCSSSVFFKPWIETREDFRLSNGRNGTAKFIVYLGSELPSYYSWYSELQIALQFQSATGIFEDKLEKYKRYLQLRNEMVNLW
jgi:hypothetical protein